MFDFQTGLTETTSKLTLIISQAEEAYLNIQRLQSETIRVHQHVNDAWNELSDQRDSFQTGVETVYSGLANEAEATFQAVDQLQAAFASVQSELLNEFEEMNGLAIALSSKIQEIGGELTTGYTTAEQALWSLVSQSVGATLDSTVSTVVENLNDIDSSIAGLQQSIEGKADTLHELVSHYCLPEFNVRTTACTNQVEGMLAAFQGQLDLMKLEARGQVEHIFQLVDGGQSIFQEGEGLQIKGFSDLSGELRTLTSVVEGFLERLADALRAGRSHVVAGIEKQAEIVTEAIEDFKETTQQMQDIKDAIDRFSN